MERTCSTLRSHSKEHEQHRTSLLYATIRRLRFATRPIYVQIYHNDIVNDNVSSSHLKSIKEHRERERERFAIIVHISAYHMAMYER